MFPFSLSASFLELAAATSPEILSNAGTKCLELLAGETPPLLLLLPIAGSVLLVSRRNKRGGERLNLASRAPT